MVLTSNNNTGKAHLAIFLGGEACRQGKRVSFQSAVSIVTFLVEAQEEKRLLKLEKKLKTIDLLVIDLC